jgi:hypothetical protein
MDRLSPPVLRCVRMSLVALWCATAVISLLEVHGRSAALLGPTAVPAGWHDAVTFGGAMVDTLVGLALWRWHRRIVYQFAAANLLIMTAAATVLLPALWLDPMGSLTKNLPIAALLWLLFRDARQ